ncbi:arylphorin subunit C223 isoform X1 [Lucilia cuprina]|uniref:arylphorin subunit C223 isoform X1 n=1 Tax=Lucilia cuprina TaxID=7375 RepID=UPI001F05FF74|nr:arylphorin subunit C223 isoform X1 [Lucilia cuprina]
MKIAIVLLAIVGLVAASSISKHDVKIADKDFLAKQKFLFEIVYRVEDPLMFEEWIKLAKSYTTFDKADYTHFDMYMEKFYEAYKHDALLPKGEFFGALVETHLKQAYGLFEFFYYAKNWEVFQRDVAWARMHCNEGMFVYALTLAVIHRDDFHGLILPSIYEIFPQYFFNSKFVYEAEKFDYDVWSKYIMYEKEYKDILYKDYETFYKNHDNHYYYYYTKDFKMWQWYKMMGLGEHWYSEDRFMLRENMDKYNKDSKYLELFEGTKMFFMPVDYTRDIEFFNEESALSYFTEDVGFNAYWYYLNMDYAFFLDGKTYGLNKDRRGEYWLYNVRQLLSRYYMERLSHGFGEIPEFSYFNTIEYGYNPQLVYYNGVGYSYRKNYYEVESYGKYDYYYKVMDFFKRLDEIITKGVYVTYEGKTIDLRKPEAIEYIGSIMQGNVDTFDKYFFKYWYMFAHMYFGDVDQHDFEVYPHVFLNYETMMRDPLFYMFYKKIASVYFQFFYYVKPYTHEELLFPGVTIKDVKVSELVTFFDLVDFDVTNLLNDKMTFVDGQFVWDKTLLARQMRLNHKPFDFDFVIESDKEQKVVIRTFLGPKYDEFGRVITLTENRENFMELDSFVYTLKSGVNEFKRYSKDFYWTTEDGTSYTELYKYVMLAFEGKYDFPLDISEPHCGFPDRLVLPHGWVKGMPMQFFFYVTPYTASYEQFSTFDYSYSCGIGSGVRYVDEMPFGYPFDREIDEYEFFVPNMYFKDVKIYHKETFDKYFEHKYEKFGHFDYNYIH